MVLKNPIRKLQAIRAGFAQTKCKDIEHIIEAEPLSLEDWNARSRPYVWHFVEENEDESIVVLRDSAYGCLCVLKHNTLVGFSMDAKFPVTGSHVVVMDKDYWGVCKYIWT